MKQRWEIKIIIQKKFVIGVNWKTGGDWKRYNTVEKILLYENGPIKTEAQLAYYIFRKHGIGRYMCLAYAKGFEGFWNYWLGNIYENGFIRDVNKDKEVEKIKGEMQKAQSYEEREMLEEELDITREINQIDKKLKRRGPLGLKKSKAGQMNMYEPFELE